MKLSRKRLFRYSLRTMLVVVTVLCVLLGWKVRQVERQKEAVAWVQEEDGLIWYDYEQLGLYGLPANPDAKPPGPRWLRDLIGVDYFATVFHVNLAGCEVSDVSPLESLTDLRVLFLSHTQVSDPTPLATLTSLQYLSLNDTKVTDEEVDELRKALPNCKIHTD